MTYLLIAMFFMVRFVQLYAAMSVNDTRCGPTNSSVGAANPVRLTDGNGHPASSLPCARATPRSAVFQEQVDQLGLSGIKIAR